MQKTNLPLPEDFLVNFHMNAVHSGNDDLHSIYQTLLKINAGETTDVAELVSLYHYVQEELELVQDGEATITILDYIKMEQTNPKVAPTMEPNFDELKNTVLLINTFSQISFYLADIFEKLNFSHSPAVSAQ